MQTNEVQDDTKGLFGALFDMTFEHFATIKFAKIIYLLLLIGWAIGMLAFLVLTVIGSAGGGEKAFTIIIVLPLVAFFTLLYMRVIMESLIVMFRIAENTRLTAESVSGTRAVSAPVSPLG